VTADSAETNAVGWQRREESDGDGIVTFRLGSWSNYFDFLEAVVFSATNSSNHKYIWRGQRRSDWPLSSSLDRLFQKLSLPTDETAVLEKRSAEHLKSFKRAARGRRGFNPAILSDYEWWALGQHFGLATPLLDWTRSPFAAAYFAFEESPSDPNDSTDYRVVYALDEDAVRLKTLEFQHGENVEEGRLPIIEFIDPMSDENQRLVSQDGLFTRAPIGTPIEKWVAQTFEGLAAPIFLRIEIPDADRLTCLRALNRMNINHLSLFPDLGGASRFTNLKLELEPKSELEQ
jgi:hypothetical protein